VKFHGSLSPFIVASRITVDLKNCDHVSGISYFNIMKGPDEPSFRC
jgi:hypothetical protein